MVGTGAHAARGVDTAADARAGVVGQAGARPESLRWLSFALPPATMVVLLAVPLILLLTPLWMHAALDLASGTVPGGDRAAAHSASDETVAQLLLGTAFTVLAPDGSALYTIDEAGHLRDVRLVLYAFLAAGAAGAAVLAYALIARSRDPATWRGIRRGAALLVAGLVVLGIAGVLAFGVAFEIFHRVLFPGGNWAFASDSNLIRLYPYAFWQLSAAAFGVLALAGAALTWAYAGRQMRRQTWT